MIRRWLAKVTLAGALLIGSLGLASPAGAQDGSGYTFWLIDGTYGATAQLHYGTSYGVYALPIFMDINGRVYEVSDFRDIEFFWNPR